MDEKLLVFDSHPVQYRVPIWRIMGQIEKNCVHVVYASDCSVTGYTDPGFGKTFSWDDPLLEGYRYTILNCEKGKPLSGWGSLTGKGVRPLINKLKPTAILLTGLNYKYDIVAYIISRFKGVPLWLRCETQDEAIAHRSKIKSFIRYIMYYVTYKGFNQIFYIGELNKEHYLRHGVPESKLVPARYGTIDRYSGWDNLKKSRELLAAREKAQINSNDFVVGFSGKLVAKKNPEILFEMLKHLPDELRVRMVIYFMGSGELEKSLISRAGQALQQFGVRTFFAGFVNQSQIASHYLAMDVLVLPSRRMGETWGLVANEAMQAGCSVVVSDAVGCSADFGKTERFRIFKDGDPIKLAEEVAYLSKFQRNFDWAKQSLVGYSIEDTAKALVENLCC